MKITCWGSRGSIPVSGSQYQKYGGDTTCLEIRTESGHLVIVDAGTGLRALGNDLMARGQREISFFYTHAHWDHVLGLPFFSPFFDPETRLTVYHNPFHADDFSFILSKVLTPPFFPIKPDDLDAKIQMKSMPNHSVQIGSMTIRAIFLNHPNGGAGYEFSEEGRRFVFLTDNELGGKHPGGLTRDQYRDVVRGADLLIHDAMFATEKLCEQSRGWGHSCVNDAADLAREAEVKKLGLFHLHTDWHDDAVDGIVTRVRRNYPEITCRAAATGTIWQI